MTGRVSLLTVERKLLLLLAAFALTSISFVILRERVAESGVAQGRVVLIQIGTAIVLLFSLVAVWGARQLVFVPVRRAIRHCNLIAGGDYSHPVRTRRRDEFGDMLGALEQMRVNLQRAVAGRDESIARLRVLTRAIDASPAAIVVTNSHGVIQYVNPAFVSNTGYAAAEAIGQTPRILNSGKHDAAFYAGLWRTIEAGQIWRGDFVNRRKDGSLFEEAASVSPVMDDAGRITHYVAVTTDVTAQRSTERRLAEAERRYRDIVEQSMTGFHQSTPDGRMVMANATLARMLGFETPKELLDEPPGLWDRLHVRADRRQQYVSQMHAGGQVQAFESQLRRRDGRLIWVAESARAVFNTDGSCSHCESFLEDITERKEAEQLKSDFVSFVTHQLRTPLSGIRWMLELAQRDESLAAETRADLDDAYASALRLIGLVNDLLDIARLESGRLTGTPAPTDLHDLAASVLTDLTPAIEANRQQVAFEGAPPPPVLVDPQLARQAVLNFISNAVKYTPPGGSIHISSSVDGNHVRWSVRDTGIGIPPAGRRRLFEKFYRAENAVALDTEGTGLGLYLVRLIAERSGGSASCESIEGEGSTFTLTLPIAAAGAAA